jgi:hypothetical protein
MRGESGKQSAEATKRKGIDCSDIFHFGRTVAMAHLQDRDPLLTPRKDALVADGIQATQISRVIRQRGCLEGMGDSADDFTH